MVVLGPAQAGQPITLIGEGKRKHSFAGLNTACENKYE
jgi:hypothetical protein